MARIVYNWWSKLYQPVARNRLYMDISTAKTDRPVALVILDGWGYAPKTESNAIAIANTPYYDEICRKYPMTTLAAAGEAVGQPENDPGNAEVGHLNIGTGRVAQTEMSKIRESIASGEFMENAVLDRAFRKAKADGSAVHLIGMVSDAGIHSSMENLFALLRLANNHDVTEVYVHGILDGLDVRERTADIYVEALEIKMADIGTGTIATLCGRYLAMDSGENWERTARVFTMLVHAEGERADDAVTAIRNSFLRGISDEFIAPIILEKSPGTPVAIVKSGDLVVFFNHRADTMRQLARSLCVPEGASGAKPSVETVCLTEYDRSFNLPAAFRQEPEKNTLAEVLSAASIPSVKITETARLPHMTYFFDGGSDTSFQMEEELFVSTAKAAELHPESQSFKITDKFRRGVESSPKGLFVVNLPAAELMAEMGDLEKTVNAIQYLDTCIGGICEKMRDVGGVVMLTSTHGNFEQMTHDENGEPHSTATTNLVPFHYIDDAANGMRLDENRSLQDVAPTVLAALGIEKPDEMTGSDLRIL
ncbi:MAG: 2,3-bisphosphoglycerate-independent phosphoglycerate mutase [Pyrinomonadaceae bacterium]